MSLPDIPGRAFLDTSVVNFILDYGEQIHDGAECPAGLSRRQVRDIVALYNIFLTGQRAAWQIAISPLTYEEVANTRHPRRRYYLENWFAEIWNYWCRIIEQTSGSPEFFAAEQTRTDLLASGLLDILPHRQDRLLICDAVACRCDCFCTRDWRSIIKYRERLNVLPIKILTPAEWWAIIEPYAALW